jgi:hypothetical protein
MFRSLQAIIRDFFCVCVWLATELHMKLRLTHYISVPQRVVRGGSPGGPRPCAGGFGRKSTAKIVSDPERTKNTPIRVCEKLQLLVDFQRKGELVFP